MAYYYKIVSREAHDDALALVVDFWVDQTSHDAGDPPHLTNNFRLDMLTSASRIVEDGRGFWKDTGGNFHDPADVEEPEPEWEYENVSLDTTEQVFEVIDAFARRAEDMDMEGDYTDRSGVRGEFKIGGNVVREAGELLADQITVPNGVDRKGLVSRQELIDITNVGRQPSESGLR